MSRSTRTDFPESFRIVLKHSWATVYKGPYQTLAAAKGQLTSETRYNPNVIAHIERTTGPWERVEA